MRGFGYRRCEGDLGMTDYDEIALRDADLLEEIDLLGELMSMATGADLPLSMDQIDTALGVGGRDLDVP